jgi:hypothetical protein
MSRETTARSRVSPTADPFREKLFVPLWETAFPPASRPRTFQ